MKKISKINEDTLEIEEVIINDELENSTHENNKDYASIVLEAMNCTPDEIYKRYKAYKASEKAFKEVYEPFKKNLIKLHEDESMKDLPNTIVLDGMKLVYVSPSTRTSIDSKRLKEEEPELFKKFTKTTDVNATIRLEEYVLESEDEHDAIRKKRIST